MFTEFVSVRHGYGAGLHRKRGINPFRAFQRDRALNAFLFAYWLVACADAADPIHFIQVHEERLFLP